MTTSGWQSPIRGGPAVRQADCRDQPGVPGWRGLTGVPGRVVRFCLMRASASSWIWLGIPTVGNVHEVARRVRAGGGLCTWTVIRWLWRIAASFLPGDERTGVVQADIRYPDQILGDPVPVGLTT